MVNSVKRQAMNVLHNIITESNAAKKILDRFRKFTIADTALSIITLAAAYMLKRHYSLAGAEDLTWILAPASFVAECLTGLKFTLEAGYGFVNSSVMIVIAKSCAGINFLIIAFCMTSFSTFPRLSGVYAKTAALMVSAASVYIATVLVNSLRIIISIYLRYYRINLEWLDYDRLHRIEGVAVYFFFLCVFYLIIQKVMDTMNS